MSKGNTLQGVYELKAGEKTYSLVFTTNTMCRLEERFDKRGMDLAHYLANPGFRDLRAMFFEALQEHHADEIKAEAAAGKVLDAIPGGLKRFSDLAGEAMLAAFGQQKEKKDKKGGAADPNGTSAAGTGSAS